jgi:hypothetical protein
MDTIPNDLPWPRVAWDQPTLDMVAQAVRRINPTVHHDSDESAASYIRSMSERQLFRLGNPEHGTMISTGGWQVTFIAGDTPHHYSAWPALTPYTVLKFADAMGAG